MVSLRVSAWWISIDAPPGYANSCVTPSRSSACTRMSLPLRGADPKRSTHSAGACWSSDDCAACRAAASCAEGRGGGGGSRAWGDAGGSGGGLPVLLPAQPLAAAQRPPNTPGGWHRLPTLPGQSPHLLRVRLILGVAGQGGARLHSGPAGPASGACEPGAVGHAGLATRAAGARSARGPTWTRDGTHSGRSGRRSGERPAGAARGCPVYARMRGRGVPGARRLGERLTLIAWPA